MKTIFRKIANTYTLQYLLLTCVAVIIWQIFYPGLMSPDSLAQYEQAKSGTYNDWHLPLMSIITRLIIKLGGDISTVILLQCLASVFGMRSVVSLLTAFFSSETITKEKSYQIGTVVTVFFLTPFFSSFILFSVIFWTDAWISILLLWIVSYILWLFINQSHLSKRRFLIHIVLFSISSAILALIRHNAVVMLLPICLILGFLYNIKLGKKWVIVASLPLILAFTLNPLINSVFSVNRTYIGNTVLASDLATMLKLYPDISNDYPLTSRHKDSPIVLLTENGGLWNDTVEGKPCPILDRKICDPKMPLSCFGFRTNTTGVDGNDCYSLVNKDNKVLKQEYFKAVMSNPVELLGAKFYLFKQILHPDYWWSGRVVCDIPKNNSGLELNSNFTEVRTNICYLNEQFANNWYFYWFFGVHLLWLIINIVATVFLALRLFIKRNGKMFLMLMLALIPLSYYFAYLLAATTADYRFMYPATLMMQTLTISLILSKLFGGRKKLTTE